MLARLNPPLFDDLFRGAFFNDFVLPRGNVKAATFAPPADIVETQAAIEVTVDLPGHDPKSLDVKLENGILTIQSERKQERRGEQDDVLRAERSFGQFVRSFELPDTVDPEKVAAKLEHGVLTVTLPKREETKPRSIAVKVQS
ncbi:MAG TPA: Hsp20/alpha crystallin family protein [Myxococcaceae bacterium]|nr:Hsp20/alpha crystallin family protein [Myxococcaceae bacterium]